MVACVSKLYVWPSLQLFPNKQESRLGIQRRHRGHQHLDLPMFLHRIVPSDISATPFNVSSVP